MNTSERGSRSWGNDDDTASQKHNEALTLQAEGQLEAAEAHCREAWRTVRQGHPRSLQAAGILNTLAAIRLDRGQFSKAREDALAAFEIAGQLGAPGCDSACDRTRVESICLAARTYIQGREFAEARPLLERAWSMAHYWLDPQSPEKVHVLLLLGMSSHESGHAHEAEEYYRKAVDLAEKVWDPFHGEVATCCLQLALLAEGAEDADALEPFGRRAYEIRCALFGSTHPLTAAAQTALAVALEAAGRVQEAGEKFVHALAIFDRHYAAAQCDHFVNPDSLRDYAICRLHAMRHLVASGRHNDAREFSTRAQQVFTRVLGNAHPLVKVWRKEHEAILKVVPRSAFKPAGYSAWEWWRGFSFSR